jgi:hypothetical protein
VVRSSLPGYPQESLGGRYAAKWDSSRSAAAHDDLPDGRQRTIYASGMRNPIGSLKRILCAKDANVKHRLSTAQSLSAYRRSAPPY